MGKLGTTNLGNSFNSINIANTNATKEKLEKFGFSEKNDQEKFINFKNTILLSAPQIKDSNVDSGYYSLLVSDSENNLCDFTYINAIDDNTFTINKDADSGKKELKINTDVLATKSYIASTYNDISTYALAKPGMNYGNQYGEIFNATTSSINKAPGKYSHAEGYSNESSGDYSHAEGNGNNSKAYGSHVEGVKNTTYAVSKNTELFGNNDYNGSHAEGLLTYTQSIASHSEGYQTYVWGDCSHAEGYNTYIGKNASFSHSEGYQTLCDNAGTHAEGYMSKALGTYSHAEGYKSLATSVKSHAEGNITYTCGSGAHAEGEFTIAGGEYSHAEGLGWGGPIITTHDVNTTIFDTFENTNIFTYALNVHSMIYYAKTNEFREVTAININRTEGDNTYATITVSGKFNKDVNIDDRNINDISNATRLYICPFAKGNGSHVEGQTGQSFGALGHAEGQYTIVGNIAGHSEGVFTYAGGNYSHAQGLKSRANGDSSHAGGECSIANGACSIASGNVVTTYNTGEAAFGRYNNSQKDDIQLFSIGNGEANGNKVTHKNILTAYTDSVYIGTSTSKTMFSIGDSFSSLESIVSDVIDKKIQAAISGSEDSTNNTFAKALNEALPIGTILLWSTSSKPDNYLICDGKEVTNDYPKLKAIMKYTPNLIGKIIVGVNDSTTPVSVSDGTNSMSFKLGQTGGEYVHKLTIDEIPSHDHLWFGDDQLNNFCSRWGGSVYQASHGYDADSGLSGASNLYLTGKSGGNKTHNNMPPYTALMYIIKAK